MEADRSLSETSRQELYDLVWSTPATALCQDFGVSDVAIAKRCRKLNVPRPSRGYWAKPKARRPRRPPLPPTPEEIFLRVARKPMPKTILLPKTCEQLHPIAIELLNKLNTSKPDSQKRLSVRHPTLPEVNVTKNLVERAAKAFHVIIHGVEPLGISFCKSQSQYDGGHFRKGHDRLYFKIVEEFVEGARESSQGRSDWYWQMKSPVPSTYLTVCVQTQRYGSSDLKRWEEGKNASLERLLPQIVTEIRQHFAEACERRIREAAEQKRRNAEAERHWREYREKEAIRLQEEKTLKHKEALNQVLQNRQCDLIKAAELWRLYQVTLEFIATCERRWRENRSESLTQEQEDWIRWATEAVATISPFEKGYPDPAKDGAFDPTTVSFGGPYPMPRDFPPASIFTNCLDVRNS